ncbi:MAG: isoprenylcysteine carboxylmethyltransferase family protein [Candidatus Bathyarchaeota archaeon]|nr:isoprenylcysteine carboxylmethyltransferase family protein [Candidatus Bathyarchaeota archaeon]
MHLKGIDKLKEKLPAYHGKRIIFIPVTMAVFFTVGFSLALLLDILPRILPNNEILYLLEPTLPILGPVFLLSIGLFLVSNVWSRRDKLLKQSKELAYQRGIIFGIIGIPLIFSAGIHTYAPIEMLLLKSPINPTTSELSYSLLTMIPSWTSFELYVRILVSLPFLIAGLLTIRQALLTFGIDYMMVVYVYYPKESKLQEHRIYSVLRHPTYFGLILIVAGGFLYRFSFYSMISFFLLVIGMLCHLMFVEEKELIERFGESYLNYRKQVPALLIKPSKIGSFIRFILDIK